MTTSATRDQEYWVVDTTARKLVARGYKSYCTRFFLVYGAPSHWHIMLPTDTAEFYANQATQLLFGKANFLYYENLEEPVTETPAAP
jgi:hypothetical protein